MRLLWLALLCAVCASGLTLLHRGHDEKGEQAEKEESSHATDNVAERTASKQGSANKNSNPPKNQDEMRDEARRVVTKVGETNAWHLIRGDLRAMAAALTPGLQVQPVAMATNGAIVLLAFVWFGVYLKFVYETDRVTNLDRWQLPRRDARYVSEDLVAGVNPDVVLVFHHPDFEYGDEESLVSENAVEQVLIQRQPKSEEDKADLPYMKRVLQGIEYAEEHASASVHVRQLQRSLAKMYARRRGEDVSDDEEPESQQEEQETRRPQLRTARIALMQDILTCSHWWGMNASVFSSIDDDELYVCLEVKDEEIQRQLCHMNMSLQMERTVVAKLGINQPVDEPESSPPFLQYGTHATKNLYNAHILQSPDDRELFRVSYDKDPKGSVVSSTERVRMVYQEIADRLNLDAAVDNGLLVCWYPVHSQTWLFKLRHCWANWEAVRDLSFVQPLSLVERYFGARVAFVYAFNGHYCKMLLAMLPLSVLALMLVVASKWADNAETFVYRSVTSFGIILVIWSRIAHNLWIRESQFFIQLWNLDVEETAVLRPEFKGDWKPDPADLNQFQLQQRSPAMAAVLRTLTGIITLLLCLLAMVWVVLWMNMFGGQLGLISSICLSIQIKVFEFLFNHIVPTLLQWENHRFHSSYYNSYLWKQFAFQFVNNYAAFFYIAIKQRHSSDGCPEGGCLAMLRMQLTIIQIVLSLSALAEILIKACFVKFLLAYEVWKYKRANDGKEPPERKFLEEQSKHMPSGYHEQIDFTLQLVIALGFVILFGGVAPGMVPFCLIVFVVRLRASAILNTSGAKRPVPHIEKGLGKWNLILAGLMRLGVLFQGFLTAVYSYMFRDTPLVTKLACVLGFWVFMELMWALVDLIWSSYCPEAAILMERRRRTQRAISYHSGGRRKTPPQSPKRRGLDTTWGRTAAIMRGDFKRIPPLVPRGSPRDDSPRMATASVDLTPPPPPPPKDVM
eukprot:TRINITY_DN32620_c0_g1_i1.p1 TRINITY_DN32620_c0_g1~~TRINITY_DN32620_c0_g1_i1.p1  ORF type:complete len:963 (+),score=171.74 TRINITY_DN32620_c0_g1_i1:78-2966(+)